MVFVLRGASCTKLSSRVRNRSDQDVLTNISLHSSQSAAIIITGTGDETLMNSRRSLANICRQIPRSLQGLSITHSEQGEASLHKINNHQLIRFCLRPSPVGMSQETSGCGVEVTGVVGVGDSAGFGVGRTQCQPKLEHQCQIRDHHCKNLEKNLSCMNRKHCREM